MTTQEPGNQMRAKASRQQVISGNPATGVTMASVIDPESSFELLERAKGGDADALDRLLRRYLPALRRWASGRLPRWARDLADTQDLIQDTVIQALKHLRNFQPQHDGALQAYLRQAVMNKIRDELRRLGRRPPPVELPEGLPASTTSPLDDAIGQEAVNRYEAALATLSDDDRAAIVARVELGASYSEVAAALGKPSPDAARMAVQRALARLATKMAHAG
jgi:RNA polymerase sigma factor (sigma-70 family)